MPARSYLVLLTALSFAACGSPSDPATSNGAIDADPSPSPAAAHQQAATDLDAARLCGLFSEAEIRAMFEIPTDQALQRQPLTSEAGRVECRYHWTIADPAAYFAEQQSRDMARMSEATQALMAAGGDRAAIEAAIRGGVEFDEDDFGPNRSLSISFMPRENRYGAPVSYEMALAAVQYNRTDHEALVISGHQALLGREAGGYRFMVFPPDGQFTISIDRAYSEANAQTAGLEMARRIASAL